MNPDHRRVEREHDLLLPLRMHKGESRTQPPQYSKRGCSNVWKIMEDDDAESQENELLALESIYEKRQFARSSEEKGGELNIYLDVPSPFLILLPSRRQSNQTDHHHNDEEDWGGDRNAQHGIAANRQRLTEITVNHLPPIVLNFKYPADYPSQKPPCFALSCKWLTKLQVKRRQ